MKSFYKNTFYHIYDEMVLIDLMLHQEILRKKSEEHKSISSYDANNGYFITEDKLNSLFADKQMNYDWFVKNNSLHEDNSEDVVFINKITMFRNKIDERIKESSKNGIELRLLKLTETFNLNEIEIKIVLLCLAPRFNREFEKLFIFLQDDSKKKHSTVDFIIKVLDKSPEQKIFIEEYLSLESTLLNYKIIEFIDNNEKDNHSLLSQQLKINEHIYFYLLGKDTIDSSLSSVSKLCTADNAVSDNIQADTFYSDELKHALFSTIEMIKSSESAEKNILFFLGDSRQSKFNTALAIAQSFNKRVLHVNSKKLLFEELRGKGLCTLLIREALLSDMIIFLDSFEVFLADDPFVIHIRESFMELLRQNVWLTCIDSMERYYGGESVTEVNFDIPDQKMRYRIWEHYLKDKKDNVDIKQLSVCFKLPEKKIKKAIDLAEIKSRISNDFKNELYKACQEMSSRDLEKLAKKIKHNFILEDLILPDNKIKQLETVITFSKSMYNLYEERGYGSLLPYGRGLTVLFSGQSGTGKTMAAGIMGNLLNLDVYRIDLATVVDKYIGETEKKLKRIFHEASYSNAILFFDEADALFGKRSEVRDAHDRFANIEISYLLQLMDDYEGITILATNLRSNIDKSFNRRFRFIIEFPLPEVDCRKRLWRAVFPKGLPLADDIDYDFLSKKIEFTGADIKAMALMAGMYAEKEGEETVNMRHVMLGVQTEYKRLGRSFYEQDFRPYYALTLTED